MIQRAKKPGIYVKHSKFQIEYLKKHSGKKIDREIMEVTRLSKMQVEYYRSQVLRIRNPSGRPVFETGSIESIKEELSALIQFYANYNGCMMDTLERRIRLLQSKV
jgi:hypothetical protein